MKISKNIGIFSKICYNLRGNACNATKEKWRSMNEEIASVFFNHLLCRYFNGLRRS